MILFLGCSVSSLSQQRQEPVLASDGTQVSIGKGWKLLKLFTDEKNRATLVYSYQTESVVKLAPSTFKFWMKIKNFEDAKEDYTLYSLEAKCNIREIRIGKIVTHFKNGQESEKLQSTLSKFEDVEPDSLFEMAFTAICKEYDKPA